MKNFYSMKLTLYIITVNILIFSACKKKNLEQHISMTSPEGDVKVEFMLTKTGDPYYNVVYHNTMAITDSRLGFLIKDQEPLSKHFVIEKIDSTSMDETWEQPWGEQRLIRNYVKEYAISLKEKNKKGRMLNIVFRIFDDGVGFRYAFPEQDKLGEFEIMDELTEFNFSEDNEAWWIPAYEGNRYEYIYKKSPVSTLKKVHTPLTIHTKSGKYLSIHEANLYDYSSMVLEGRNKNLKCDLVPWSTTNNVKCFMKTPSKTPWRTIQLAESPGDLITNYMILNLNEPNKIGDVSWFKPGKYVGIWWEMHINTGTWNQGPKHAANTANTKKYIDFAAKHGFDGVLVEGWNYGWDGQWMNSGAGFKFSTAYPDYDIDALSKYGKEKDVYIIGHHETGAGIENYESQLEEAFQFLEDHGMKAVKTGYVENGDTLTNGCYHHGQFYVRHFRKVIETAARHKVAIVAHEPIKDTGERRTFPNMISREGARGQEYEAWSPDGGNPPSHTVILPFTRMLSGPMDYTPGVFDIKLPTQPNNQINTTLAKQLALYIVLYSPMQMACDLPENYEGHPAFKFIEDVAVDWETTKVLEGSIGAYITIARQVRGKNQWFVGSITDENPRTTKISLDFLTPGIEYTATIYKDGKDADYRKNPTSYAIEEMQVDSNTELEISLASSGGAAINISAP